MFVGRIPPPCSVSSLMASEDSRWMLEPNSSVASVALFEKNRSHGVNMQQKDCEGAGDFFFFSNKSVGVPVMFLICVCQRRF